jgi:hypothetical protein
MTSDASELRPRNECSMSKSFAEEAGKTAITVTAFVLAVGYMWLFVLLVAQLLGWLKSGVWQPIPAGALLLSQEGQQALLVTADHLNALAVVPSLANFYDIQDAALSLAGNSVGHRQDIALDIGIFPRRGRRCCAGDFSVRDSECRDKPIITVTPIQRRRVSHSSIPRLPGAPRGVDFLDTTGHDDGAITFEGNSTMQYRDIEFSVSSKFEWKLHPPKVHGVLVLIDCGTAGTLDEAIAAAHAAIDRACNPAPPRVDHTAG